MRTVGGLQLNPFLPDVWQGYGFQFEYRGRLIRLDVRAGQATARLLRGDPLTLSLCGQPVTLTDSVTCSLS